MLCSKCGNELQGKDAFCPACGNKIDNTIENTSKKSQQKNPGIIPLLCSLVIQIICVVCDIDGGTFGKIMIRICIVFVFITLGLSIFCIVKSKRVVKHRGKALGIVFTVLSSLLIFIVSISLIATRNDESVQANKAAKEAIEVLKDCLKSPSSLYLNSVVVEVKSSKTKIIVDGEKQNDDEPFDGYYTVYIDYSAANSLGGTTRSYFRVAYYVIGTKKTLIDAKKIEKIPQLTGKIYKIN